MGTSERAVAGRYVLLDQVGTGGMGSVWRAWDLRERRHVAVKVLGRHDDALLQRFVREQSVRVPHPHVVAPRDWAAEGGRVLIAMDLVAGGSLADLLAEHGPLPEAQVAVLLDQLLQALGAVHAAGIVHRDVKPANLLLEPTTGPPHLRLADFGVAAVLAETRLTHAATRVGTRGYAAPEQERGETAHPLHDLYAVGVLGRHLLTGRDPVAVPAGPHPRGALGPLLDALADPDPARRPRSAHDARERLRRLAPPAPPHWPSVPDRLGPAPGRGDPGRLALALACLCFTAALVLSAVGVLRLT